MEIHSSITNICRLCICQRNETELMEIFSKIGQSLNVSSILADYLGIKLDINDNDPYSKFICNSCWDKTYNFHQFYNEIQLAQKQFYQQKNVQFKYENIDTDAANDNNLIVKPLKQFEKNIDISDDNTLADSLKQFESNNDIDTENDSNNDNDIENDSDDDNDKDLLVDSLKLTENIDNVDDNKTQKINVKEPSFPIVRYISDIDNDVIAKYFEFKCNICADITLDNFTDNRLHYKNVHKKSNACYGICRMCNIHKTQPYKIREHIILHGQPTDKFQCSICKKSMNYLYSLRKHVPRCQRINNLQNSSDSIQSTFLADEQKCDSSNESTLSIPTNSQITSINDKEQISENTEINPFPVITSFEDINDCTIKKYFELKCYICSDDKLFDNYNNSRLHYQMVHNKLNKCYGTCRLCKAIVTNKNKIHEHIILHGQPTEKFQCSICKKSWKLSADLRKHEKLSHNIVHAYECKKCDDKFASRQSLSSHSRIHLLPIVDSVERVPCNICGKIYSKWSLSKHIASFHKKVKSYICEKCGVSYDQLGKLKFHIINTHTDGNELRVQCKICDKWQKNKLTLQKHLKNVHSPAQVQCEHCKKLYKSKTQLRVHIRRHHEKLNQYKCNFCDKVYCVKFTLKNHIAAKHTGECRHTCEFCGEKFSAYWLFCEHRSKKHKDQWQEELRLRLLKNVKVD